MDGERKTPGSIGACSAGRAKQPSLQDVTAELKKLLDLYARINPDQKQKDAVARLIARADGDGVFTGTLSPTDQTIKLNFKRIARLLAPRSLAMVKAYGEFLNRDAFEHPFGAKKPVVPKSGQA